MKFKVKKSHLSGSLTLPSSKSQTLRAILFASLSEERSTISNYLHSPDTESMLSACKLLGAKFCIDSSHIHVHNGLNFNAKDAVIFAGNSGIVLRFISAVVALGNQSVIVSGDHSLQSNRPMKEVMSGIIQLGGQATSLKNQDYAPIVIKGPLKGGYAVINGEDSQPVSALLIAAAFAENPTKIQVINPGEKPWVNLTLDWFDRLGIYYTNENFENYSLIGKSRCPGFNYHVPGDLSSAAFPTVAALITRSALTLKNVDMDDLQGDKKLFHELSLMGARFEINSENNTLNIPSNQSQLIGKKIDINDCIDAIAALAVIGCFAEGETLLYNAAIARKKECDRLTTLTNELRKMGANIEESPDALLIRKSELKGAVVHSNHDHRIAMALTIAGMAAQGKTDVHDVLCIQKTYPYFLEQFQEIGGAIEKSI